MSAEMDFKPKLGKIRSLGSKRARRYVQQVLRAVALAGGVRGKSSSSRFYGNRIGRGSGVGRVLAARDGYAAFRVRRVIIKSRIVKMRGKGVKAARLHVRYIQRDGVTREGAPGELYDAREDGVDGKAFVERAEGDRHSFRFIVSAEDGAEYDDLKTVTRKLMNRMEEDLVTKLDWVAVDHYNTAHPHTHIVLRGQDDRGKDLIIARDYLTQGMRERAAEIVTLDFGPRSDFEIESRLRLEIDQERYTSLDRRLVKDLEKDGLVRAHSEGLSGFQQTLRAGRLQKLRRLGLAEETSPSVWRLAPDMEETLKRMGARGDIINTMHREFAERGMARSMTDYVVYDPADPKAQPIVGRIIARGLSDEINDRHYLIVDGVDGRSHYVDIGRGEATDPTIEGSVIGVSPKPTKTRPVDRTVADIAAANGGRYSVDLHLRSDPTASSEFAESHVRRLEAIRRLSGAVERTPDGTWLIAADHLERATQFERQRAAIEPVIVQIFSSAPLHRMIDAGAATWLDHELIADAPTPLRDAGFGRETKDALRRRQQWLVEQELATNSASGVVFTANMLSRLRRRELTAVGSQLGSELGLHYVELAPHGRVEGVYLRPVDLVSGRFAVIQRPGRDFTLVPWRPVLERNLGQQVSGMVRGDRISWTLNRGRGGPGV